MKYILVFITGVSVPPQQVGPFDNVFACEQAHNQIKQLAPKTRAVCVNLEAKPHHWNGKKIPK